MINAENQGHLECVGKGWHPLVLPLIEQCEAEDVKVFQVKEKFGGLRFYTDGNTSEKLNHAIDSAEVACAKTCEECGAPGTLRTGGWLKTLCDEHAKGRKDFDHAQD